MNSAISVSYYLFANVTGILPYYIYNSKPYIPYPTTAIIFNMRSQNELLPEPPCAFIRHAFGCFYDAFSQIDLANKPFIPTLVFHETLLSYRSAVLRYAYTIRLLYIKRRFTSKKLKTPPKKHASVSLP